MHDIPADVIRTSLSSARFTSPGTRHRGCGGYRLDAAWRTGTSRTHCEPSIHVYKSYGWLRGFSLVPSWGARIEEAWWYVRRSRHARRSGLARQVHANCLRLWIEFSAWMAQPDKVTANFLDAVAAID